MKKAAYWTIAVVITLVLSIYQRMTGPTHPKKVVMELNDASYKMKLPRSGVQHDVIITLNDIPQSHGNITLHYRRYPTQDEYTSVDFKYLDNKWQAALPVQPVAGKLQYYITADGQNYPADEPVVIDNRRKVMVGGYKINGYRVQAFAGGNQRKDRQKAEQIGNTIKAKYPEEPIYVHFYSPRWICRVGNYRTYEEAHEMLMNIRKLGISGASIVKGKITVQY